MEEDCSVETMDRTGKWSSKDQKNGILRLGECQEIGLGSGEKGETFGKRSNY